MTSNTEATTKFHIGQQVVWIFRDGEEKWQPWKCVVETIEGINTSEDAIIYYGEYAWANMPENQLFASFDEAMQFLRDKLTIVETAKTCTEASEEAKNCLHNLKGLEVETVGEFQIEMGVCSYCHRKVFLGRKGLDKGETCESISEALSTCRKAEESNKPLCRTVEEVKRAIRSKALRTVYDNLTARDYLKNYEGYTEKAENDIKNFFREEYATGVIVKDGRVLEDLVELHLSMCDDVADEEGWLENKN